MEAQNEPSIFDTLEEEVVHQPASQAKRFGNYFIDTLIVVSVIKFALFFAFGIFYYYAFDEQLIDLLPLEGSLKMRLLEYALSAFVILIYYTIIEKVTNGRSIGKYITKTIVAREDKLELTWKDTLLRSLSRIVPFDPLSAIGGYPWHDKWTKTLVTDFKKRSSI